MKKKSLISLLLVCALAISFVFGAMMIGTQAQESVELYTVGDLGVEGATVVDSIQDALADLEEGSREWSAATTAEIQIKGSDHSGGAQNGVIFGQATIWRADGSKLPITIRGIDTTEKRDAYIYLDAAGGWYACANDYTFVNLTLPVGDQETFFFAGSGDVKLVECAFTSGGALTVETVQDRTNTYMNARTAAIAVCEDADDLITPDLSRLPCGEAWQAIRNSAEYHATGTVVTDKNGDPYVDKDLTGKSGTFYGDYSHAGDTGGGQYLNACVYYEAILGLECKDNPWRPTSYALDEELVLILQKAAHDAVVEVYGEDHFKNPIDFDVDDNGVVNLLMMGSSSSYYMRDELHLMARHIGIDLRVVHAYSSGIKMSTQWSWAKNGTGKWTVYTEWNGTTSSGVQNQKLSDYVNDYPWDVIVTYQTGNAFNKKNLGSGFSDTTVAKALEGCSTADEFINFVYSYNNTNPNARYFWFQTVGAPIGAPGPGGDAKGYFYGDNCTSAVYAGWTEADLAHYTVNGKLAASSITFGKDSDYNSQNSAVGYISTAPATALTDETANDVKFLESAGFEEYNIPEVLPVNTVGKLVVDGAALDDPRLHMGFSPASAVLHVKSGTTGSITTCNKGTDPRYGDVTIRLTGGMVDQVDALREGHLVGDLTFYMDESDGDAVVSGMLRMGFNKVHTVSGDIVVDVRGGEINGTVYSGGAAGGTVYNSFSNCIITGEYFAMRSGAVSRVVNTFKNCELKTNYYGGHWDASSIGIVENHMDGVTIGGNYYGGSYNSNLATTIPGGKITIDGKEETLAIYNDIKSMTVVGNYYGASRTGVVGAIRNDITSITVTGNYYGCGSAILASTSYGNVTNNIRGGVFNGTYFGGTQGDKTKTTVGDVVNNISGGTFKKGYYGASAIRTTNSVTNNISGGVFENPTAKNSDNKTVYLYSFNGGSQGGPITTNVVNNISGGDFKCAAILGSGYEMSGSVINNISGGTFALTSCGAGKGKIGGNVENTISGTAEFKLGFYAGYSLKESSATTITGNIINKVQPGPTEKLPYFGRSPAYLLSKDGTTTSVYDIGNSDFGFMGGNNNGAVNGYVQNEITGGYFYGHWHGANNSGSVKGKNADGDCIINKISGGTFAYRAYGGTVSSNTLAGNIRNEISGGLFKYEFAAGHRAGTSSLTSTTFSQDINTYIYGDPVFEKYICGVARGWNVEQSGRIRLLGDAVLTIEGGTFKAGVYGLCNNGEYGGKATSPGARIDEGGSLTVNINGGTFSGDIFATSPNFDTSLYHKDGLATVNIAPTKGDIIMQSKVVSRFANEIIQVGGGTYKLKLGKDSSVEASSYDGKILVVEQTEQWKSGTTYLALPAAADTSAVIATQKENVSGIAKKTVEESKTLWVGSTGVENNVYGVNLILKSKIELRVWLNKAEVDGIGADFVYAITREGLDKAILSGTYADLLAKAEVMTQKIGGVDTEFYTLVLPGTAPSEYGMKYSICGTGFNVTELCMNDLLRIVIDDQNGQFTEGFKTLAKALWNYGIKGYDRFSGKTSDLTLEALSAPTEAGIVASGAAGTSQKITLVGKALFLREAVGLRYYLNLAEGVTAEDLTVSLNGEVLDPSLINFAAEEGNGYNASITLYISAGSMDRALTVNFTAPDGDAGSYTESITSFCQQYVNAQSADAELCSALLRYAQAIPGMNS